MSGRTKVSRLHAPSAATTAAATSSARTVVAGTLRADIRLPLELLPERRLAAGAVGDLALELAAGRVDVVAARAPHRRDHAGGVELLLERADRLLVRALEAGAGERVERDQVDLGRILGLHPA